MRKGSDGGEKRKKERKIMTFLVATNVVASGLPERRPTGTAIARDYMSGYIIQHECFSIQNDP